MIKIVFFQGYLIVKNKFLDENKSKKYIDNLLNEQSIEEVFRKINGSFRLSFENDEIIWFGSDHFGGYPLFYQIEPNFKIILNPFLEKNKDISDSNFLEFMTFGYTLGNKTIYQNILECNPGVLYFFSKKNKKLSKIKWFEYFYQGKQKYRTKDLAKLLTDSVQPFINKNIFLPLTGGLDTRTILGININLRHNPRIFSNGSKKNRDVEIAQEISKRLGLDFILNEYNTETKKMFFKNSDFKKMVSNAFWGRSLPHDLDWISAKNLPQKSEILSGHSGDWISGSYFTPELFKIRNISELSKFIMIKNPFLTGISSKNHQKSILESIKKFLENKEFSDIISLFEIFEFENHQRKYNVNSAWIYRGENKKAFLPFFDRRILTVFKSLKLTEKLGEKFYIETLKKEIFKNDAEVLSKIKTTRLEFYNGFNPKISLKSKFAHLLNLIDKYRIRKRFLKMDKKWEEIISLFDKNPHKFFNLKIEEAFPEIESCIIFLEKSNAKKSAYHLKTIKKMQVCQIQINGLFILKFLPYILGVS